MVTPGGSFGQALWALSGGDGVTGLTGRMVYARSAPAKCNTKFNQNKRSKTWEYKKSRSISNLMGSAGTVGVVLVIPTVSEGTRIMFAAIHARRRGLRNG